MGKTKRTIVISVLLLIICLNITSLAAIPALPDTDQFIALGEAMKGKDAIKASADDVAIAFIPILQTIGNLLIVIVIGIMGIRWMYAEPRKRAELKENMIGYIIGIAIMFCGVNITAIVTDYFETQFKVGPYKGTLVKLNPIVTVPSGGGTVIPGGSGTPSSGGVSVPMLNFVGAYEGFSGYGYRGADFWNVTIGYGHVIRPGEHFNEPLTQEQARALLESDMQGYVAGVKKLTSGLNLSQQQFDALVSFAYNCGVGGLGGSSLLRDIKGGASLEQIRADFLAWSKCAGVTLPGLYKRRMDEFQMFAAGDYQRN